LIGRSGYVWARIGAFTKQEAARKAIPAKMTAADPLR